MTDISGENYKVTITDNTVLLEGTLRLRGLEEYATISTILEEKLTSNSCLIIDVQKLEFLNSSGIAMLSKFIIHARKNESIDLSIIGSQMIPWQGKSLKNLQRLMPQLKLEII